MLSEIDYLLSSRLGPQAELDFLLALQNNVFERVSLQPEDFDRCSELMQQYADLALGLADAAVVSVAERLGVPRLLTVDERHFRVVQPRGVSHFVLLPSDAPV